MARPYKTPSIGASENWLKYQKAGESVPKKGNTLAKAGVISSGIGNMLANFGDIIEKYETTKAFRKLGEDDVGSPTYEANIKEAIKRAPNAEVAGAFFQILRGLQESKNLSPVEKTKMTADMATKDVFPVKTTKDETTGQVPEPEEGQFDIEGLGRFSKKPKSQETQKPMTLGQFGTKYKVGTPKSKDAIPLEVDIGGGDVKTVWGIPYISLSQDEGKYKNDSKEYERFLGQALTMQGVRPLFALETQKWTSANDMLNMIDGVSSGKIIPDKRIALELSRSLDNLTTVGSGGGASAEMAKEYLPETWKQRFNQFLEKASNEPQKYLNKQFLDQFVHQIKRQAEFYGQQVDNTIRGAVESKNETLWKRRPEWKKKAIESIKMRFTNFFRTNPDAKPEDLMKIIKEDYDRSLVEGNYQGRYVDMPSSEENKNLIDIGTLEQYE